jgi:hypothetical protein
MLPQLPNRTRAVLALLLVASVVSVALAWATAAHADGTYDGPWNMSSISETFTVQQWSGPCGKAPESRTMLAGGPVTIRSDSGELVITGARTLRTDQCLDPLPTLVRTVHSQDARSWRTRCASPQTDPRHAVVNTLYFVAPGDDSITITETGRYEFAINEARCIADVQRASSLTRANAAPGQAASPPPAAAAPPTAGAPSPASRPAAADPALRPDCSVHGSPARLEVWPSRKLLRLGDVFAFHARVLDSSGCSTGTPLQWSVANVLPADPSGAARAQPTVDPTGKLTVPAQDFSDATFDVVVTAAGHSARAKVQVTVPANYEALLAQSGLGPSGERAEPAVENFATTAIGASGARAEDGSARRRLWFVGVVGGLSLVLGGVALVGMRRSRRVREAHRAAEERHAEKLAEYERGKRDREQKHAAQMKAHLESVALAQQQAAAAAARGVASGPMFCPSCRRELPAGTTHCPFDSNRLVAVAGHEDLMSGPAGGVCPTCGRGYNPGVKVCPADGETLVPAPVAMGIAPQPVVPSRGKICPTCGDRFDGAARFCGKDGTQLVLLN